MSRSDETLRHAGRHRGTLHIVTLTQRLQSALRDAMREKDTTLVATLRSTLAALANAQAVPHVASLAQGSAHVAGAAAGVGAAEAQRRSLSAQEERAIVAAEIQDLAAHASRLETAGRRAEADDVRRTHERLALLATDPLP